MMERVLTELTATHATVLMAKLETIAKTVTVSNLYYI
jgi:hypothetical protein